SCQMLFASALAARRPVHVTQSAERMLDRVQVCGETVFGTRQNAAHELPDHFGTRHALLCCQPVECHCLLFVEVNVRALHTPQHTSLQPGSADLPTRIKLSGTDSTLTALN